MWSYLKTWLLQRRLSKAQQRLIEVLEQTKLYIAQSEESIYSPFTPTEIASDLTKAIESLKGGHSIDTSLLQMHFAPASSIQETALNAGWVDPYLDLSRQFDELIEAVS
ncbi:hypothetical protein GCM10023213_25250 [Prosthecobacter algae]|uniref:Uncharacterized protein n=1 Tax=Prosthecobacter algae TaxID=1144682 RepID=A0ABP9P5U5_9BACT